MSRRVIVRPEAEADIMEAALWYEHRVAGLGSELLAEVDSIFGRVAERPRTFTVYRHRPEVRRALIRRFPFRVFFVVRDDAVVVFAVMHAARHDRHWLRRL